MKNKPKRTTKYPTWVKLNMWISGEMAKRIDRKATEETRATRTNMARALLERALKAEEASL